MKESDKYKKNVLRFLNGQNIGDMKGQVILHHASKVTDIFFQLFSAQICSFDRNCRKMFNFALPIYSETIIIKTI